MEREVVIKIWLSISIAVLLIAGIIYFDNSPKGSSEISGINKESTLWQAQKVYVYNETTGKLDESLQSANIYVQRTNDGKWYISDSSITEKDKYFFGSGELAYELNANEGLTELKINYKNESGTITIIKYNLEPITEDKIKETKKEVTTPENSIPVDDKTGNNYEKSSGTNNNEQQTTNPAAETLNEIISDIPLTQQTTNTINQTNNIPQNNNTTNQTNQTANNNQTTSTTQNVTPICGDGKISGGEMCDGETRECTNNGIIGTQSCNSLCNGWNTCQIPTNGKSVCGNKKIEAGENCDGGVKSCSMDGKPITTTCTSSGCTFSSVPGLQTCSSDCSSWNACQPKGIECGNGAVEAGEECDRNSKTCTSLGYNGFQSCNSQCSGWKACQQSNQRCGDGLVNGNEVCDRKSKSCTTTSGNSGTQICNSTCSGWETCQENTTSQNCGNHICESRETYYSCPLDCLLTTCTDTDGNSLGIKGTISGRLSSNDGIYNSNITYSYTDTCLSDGISLAEYSCWSNSIPAGNQFIYDCRDYGYASCSNGACVGTATTSTCGNGIIGFGEVCDDNFQGCYVNGVLGMQTCNSQCNGWNTCKISDGGSCYDEDGSDNFVKGTLKAYESRYSSVTNSYTDFFIENTDYCSNNQILQEFICSSSNTYSATRVVCTKGCQDGTCIK